MNLQEYARLETRDGQPVALLGAKLAGDLRGLLFEARMEQSFCNSTDTSIEVVYSFPLPWGAVLLGIDALLGNKHLKGEVVEKNEAEIRYENAISDGNAAIMLEKTHDHNYSLNLGNLAAQERCVITLRYAQTLQFEQHGLRVLVPTVIAPRYGDALVQGGLTPHQAPSHSLLAEYPIEVEIRLHDGLARGRVASPSHPVRVAHSKTEAGDLLVVSLARTASLDRDFVLVVDQLSHESMTVLAQDCVESNCVAVLASFCPRIETQEPPATVVKILVDCSGSMAGDSIAAAQRALKGFIDHLSQGDRFSLSRFGSTVQHRSRGLWKATETTKVAARRWVDSLTADLGGTEMEAALLSTFALTQTASSDVLIVTDGEISAIDDTIKSAKASGHRVFVVGIGTSPAETHLRRLAEATGGACDFVAPGEAIEPAVLRMFVRLRSPRLSGLSVLWPAGCLPHWVSPVTSSVFDGDTLNVFALFRQIPAGEVTLMGTRFGDSSPKKIARAVLSGTSDSGDVLSRVAASIRFQSSAPDWLVGVTQESIELAVAYQLVTNKTTFLLVHERPDAEKALEMPALFKVDQMAPAGWAGASSVRFCLSDHVFECRSIDYEAEGALDWSEVDGQSLAPVIQTASDASAQFSTIGQDDIAGHPHQYNLLIDRSNPLYWFKSEHYSGLTPLGLSERLRVTPMSKWPISYTELLDFGLGAWLTDWLELTIGQHLESVNPESTLIQTFLYLMSRRDTHSSLTKPQGVVNAFNATGERLRGGTVTSSIDSPTSVDLGLVEAIAAALTGLTAEAWPEQVFAMTGADS